MKDFKVKYFREIFNANFAQVLTFFVMITNSGILENLSPIYFILFSFGIWIVTFIPQVTFFDAYKDVVDSKDFNSFFEKLTFTSPFYSYFIAIIFGFYTGAIANIFLNFHVELLTPAILCFRLIAIFAFCFFNSILMSKILLNNFLAENK